ncbi:hypothetical protein BU24DRAFT_465416 [Aaosphaeria arxii CBS 175.79]|uniref:Uncharacterized protein n=1 Tax=Aaosphaeria arxii CBS 175.79 TaxID=1450172 RepID=A0A6A5XFB4_9PLEO|nr:uncharacterized protein BU24DRAFT_465416 [Aaosphaeria arxii CBS 175.79]KAF2011818.1 hypothetical protein BU24DRAFT_465416 [Aaosphaeria arxii CBS 175.79]
MAQISLHKRSLPALACTADDSKLLPCTCHIKYDQVRLYATFTLQHVIDTNDATTMHSFTFIYNSDNLHPETTTYTTSGRDLTQLESQHIARNITPKVRALSLQLKKPCAILCPKERIPRPTHLIGLAKATDITIIFDRNWLTSQQHRFIFDIVAQPETFSGFPIDEKNLKGRRLDNWTVFYPADDRVSNEPHPYIKLSSKRSLQESDDTAGLSPPKRILCTPVHSPTKEATVIPTPRSWEAPPNIDGLQHAPLPPSTPSPYAVSVRTPTPHSLPPRAESLHNLEDDLTTIFENTAYDAQYLRSAADDEFLSAVEEQRQGFQYSTEDALREFLEEIDRIVDETFCKLEEKVVQYLESVEESVEEQFEKVITEKVDRFAYAYGKWMMSVARSAAGSRGGRMTRKAGQKAIHQKN